jgi:hypothetical protein
MLRQQQAEPVLLALKQWLDGQRPQALPKSPLGAAIGYALNHWEALQRYLEQGYLSIDNNLSERTLRAIALSRNAWGVIGSEAGGQTAGVLYTLVGTCKTVPTKTSSRRSRCRAGYNRRRRCLPVGLARTGPLLPRLPHLRRTRTMSDHNTPAPPRA